MRHKVHSTAIGMTLIFGVACLEPPEDDEAPLSSLFADPNIPDDMYPHVEDGLSPERLAQFSADFAYLRGFADGQPIWYWNVDGANSTIIAPLFRVFKRDGTRFDRTVIDVIPGDAGYTPWWRIVDLELTELHNGELFRSREALDAGVRLGLLTTPERSTSIVNCPVSRRGSKIPLSGMEGDEDTTTWVWYRNQRVDWVVFTEPFSVDRNIDRMPKYPVYVLQRIDEGLPIYEFATRVDINGDGKLNDSNNIFANGLAEPTQPIKARYSPLWFVSWVRTEANYLSIDTSTSARLVGLSAEDQFWDPEREQTLSTQVIGKPVDMKDMLVNCPIQRTRGMK